MILNFKNFIVEKLGIAVSSIRYSDILIEKVENKSIEFINSKNNTLKEELKLERNELSSFFGNLEEYMKFPVNEIRLKLEFKKTKGLADDYDSDFYCGGAAFPFGHKNWSQYSNVIKFDEETKGLNLLLMISLELDSEFKYNNEIRDEISSTLWHELNHLYEMYNRFLNKKGPVIKRSMSVSLSYLDKNKWKIKSEIFQFWSEKFIYLIYRSDKSEINANVQESAYKVTKYGFDKVLNSEIWIMSNKMKNFDSDEFIKNLESIIIKHYNINEVEFIKDRLKRMTIDVYKDNIEFFREDPTIDIEKIKKLTFDGFVKYFSKRINKSGDNLRRKIIKLKSIEDEKI
jgi:hypothetical protein